MTGKMILTPIWQEENPPCFRKEGAGPVIGERQSCRKGPRSFRRESVLIIPKREPLVIPKRGINQKQISEKSNFLSDMRVIYLHSEMRSPPVHSETRGGRINPRQIHNKSDFPSEMTVRWPSFRKESAAFAQWLSLENGPLIPKGTDSDRHLKTNAIRIWKEL